ncbi:MAG: PaaI family thioesterase, partial [Rhizobiales bacterium]|nr:PaaI family thioesterase [Hyphomicrobiales bacterium]
VLDDTALRPGGTVMGPAMMKVADVSCYVLLLGHDGEQAALSVTTNMAMSFLRKPEPGDIVCEINTLKHGRTLVVMHLKIYSAASNDLIANAEMTYYNAVR